MGGAPARAREHNHWGLSVGSVPRTVAEPPYWQLLESYLSSPKNTAGKWKITGMGMGVGQMAFLSPLPDQQDFWIFILSLTDEENKLCVACVQSLGESGYGWLWELRGLLGQSTHWTYGERSQRSSGHCAESFVSWGALK